MSRVSFRLLFAQTMDALTFLAFYLFIGPGQFEERAGPALFLMSIGGIWLLPALKIGTALVVGIRLDRAHFGRLERLAVVGASIGAASGIVGAGFNTAAIIRSIP
jgi:hypothetical protein